MSPDPRWPGQSIDPSSSSAPINDDHSRRHFRAIFRVQTLRLTSTAQLSTYMAPLLQPTAAQYYAVSAAGI